MGGGNDGVGRMVAGRYRLHELLGRGGMGTVWRATDELLGRTVALKQVRLDGLPAADAAVARERTMREARIAAALHHPHVVTVFDVVIENDEPWLVMEYVPARSLGNLLGEWGALPPVDVAMIGAQIAGALAAAHASGIVHRDVKPDNVLVTGSPAAPMVKLADFGISHAAAVPALTATGVLTGTPAYFAPETARGEATDARSDMYSLGATLYAAVEGQPPFGPGEGNLLAFLARIGRGGAPPPRQAGPLTGLLRDLTADAPAARPTAVQAQHALCEMAASMGRPIAPTRTFEPPGRRRRALAIAAVALAAAAAVVATVLVVGSGEPASPPQAAPTTPAGTTPADGTSVAAVPGPLAVERTADPCSLLDPAVLNRFGKLSIEPHNGRFRECTANLDATGGGVLGVYAELFNGAETQRTTSGWSPPADGPRVLESDVDEEYCEHRVLHPDGSSALLSISGPKPVSSLCLIAAAVAEAGAARLVAPGIGQRAWPADSVLAARNACDLLTSEEAARATGTTARSWPGFGGFSCQWGLPESTTSNVTIAFARRLPFGAEDGEPADVGGKPGRMVIEPGGWCSVVVQQREYMDDTGNPRIEVMNLYVYRPEPASCTQASELATIASSRLDAA
ncbi:serine/threonine protein kinase [Pseudonocardia sp. DSM 110487]|uniref:serine/threonine-protein kinase n=1 Tax=Pseudonocardia sp. DSM 110487 TaxID=2865833 RepID=UPI001C6A70E5|nr:serine/threonine-protein kinase [Pseudonocardia sp. DSM 110487]QYN34721.1 serine/threonine protein kinase [Pseudonocardia sp. DSM 110487]